MGQLKAGKNTEGFCLACTSVEDFDVAVTPCVVVRDNLVRITLRALRGSEAHFYGYNSKLFSAAGDIDLDDTEKLPYHRGALIENIAFKGACVFFQNAVPMEEARSLLRRIVEVGAARKAHDKRHYKTRSQGGEYRARRRNRYAYTVTSKDAQAMEARQRLAMTAEELELQEALLIGLAKEAAFQRMRQRERCAQRRNNRKLYSS